MHSVVVTNNPLVERSLSATYSVEFVDGACKDVLVKTRDRIHRGAMLVTHPLYGSMKLDSTPYRSVIVENCLGPVDDVSLRLIEAALVSCGSFSRTPQDFDQAVVFDLQTIDLALLRSALDSRAQQVSIGKKG